MFLSKKCTVPPSVAKAIISSQGSLGFGMLRKSSSSIWRDSKCLWILQSHKFFQNVKELLAFCSQKLQSLSSTNPSSLRYSLNLQCLLSIPITMRLVLNDHLLISIQWYLYNIILKVFLTFANLNSVTILNCSKLLCFVIFLGSLLHLVYLQTVFGMTT